MSRFDDALYNAATADDPALHRSFMPATSADRRVSTVRRLILRFLEGVDEDVTALEIRQALEE